jgi:VanZ family protein
VLKNILIHSVNLFYTLSIGLLSLVHISEVPKLNTGFDDKIVHFILYAGLCFTWFISLHTLKKKSSLLLACVISIVFGTVIEFFQGVAFINRTADVFDLLANCLGIFTMAFFIFTKKEAIVKKL